jgi:hypothetical protein
VHFVTKACFCIWNLHKNGAYQYCSITFLLFMINYEVLAQLYYLKMSAFDTWSTEPETERKTYTSACSRFCLPPGPNTQWTSSLCANYTVQYIRIPSFFCCKFQAMDNQWIVYNQLKWYFQIRPKSLRTKRWSQKSYTRIGHRLGH